MGAGPVAVRPEPDPERRVSGARGQAFRAPDLLGRTRPAVAA